MTEPRRSERSERALRFVVLMGFVAMMGDVTYEGARSVVGPYLGLLGASAATIGFVAGLGELVGYGLRLGTGWLADRTRAYWPLTIAGYATNLVAVPGLAFVGRVDAALALVLLERLGKAIRSPARSTLVSYATKEVGAGFSFGLEEALDQLGAFLGPLLVAAAMALHAGDALERYRAGFAILAVPVLLNLALLLTARARYPRPEELEPEEAEELASFGGGFRRFLLGAMLVGVGFADWALVAYHLGRTGMVGELLLPIVYSGAMASDAVAALLVGRAFDRVGPRVLVGTTLISATFAPLVFLGGSLPLVLLGALAWSIGMGAQESTFKATIATVVAKEHRGRAYGVFFAAFGVAWWLGSWAMGALYDRSLVGLVMLSVIAQVGAVPVFWGMKRT